MVERRRNIRLLVRTVLPAVVGGALAVGVFAPAYAQPTDVPDAGTRPAPAGELALPDGSAARLPAHANGVDGPLAGEIAAVEDEIADLVTLLRELEPQLADATAARVDAEDAWQVAEAERAAAEQVLTALVEDAYRHAAAVLPHFSGVPLRDLAAHAPLQVNAPLGVEAAGRKLLRTEQAAERATADYQAALEAELALDGRVRGHGTQLATLQGQLEDLRDRNAAALIAAEQAEQRRAAAGEFPLLDSVAGQQAGDLALQAVDFALQQLGKPYLWGAQGPDRYDCSGLVWDAYRSVGITVPRVAADQFNGTRNRPVARNALLPGDLVFFSSNPADWRQIGHVGMYLGDGRMVHAPNRNEVVKVGPVWWSRFFGATRVVPAVPAPEPSPSPSPSPSPPPTTPPTTPPPTTPPPTTPPPSSPTLVTVPDVAGMTAGQAEQEILDAGLTPLAGDPVTAGCDDPGTVAAQEPAAGTDVEQGSTVVYRICEPAVPEVADSLEQEAEAALAALREMGFDFEITIVYALSDAVEPGRVIQVDPAVGTPLAGVSEITLTVSGVEVPDLTGGTVASAVDLLTGAQLDWRFEDTDGEPADPDPADPVVDQMPARGEVLALGGLVVIIV
jgi:peptidoglycan DL-endopeptidase CwlO